MNPLWSHILVWPIVLLSVVLAILWQRGERIRPCTGHRFCWPDGYCELCLAPACPTCGGEGTVYGSYNERVEGGGKECYDCAGEQTITNALARPS